MRLVFAMRHFAWGDESWSHGLECYAAQLTAAAALP